MTSKNWRNSITAGSNFSRLLLLFAIVVLAQVRLVLHAEPPVLQAHLLEQAPPNIIRTCCAFGVDLSVARIPFVKKSDIIGFDQLGFHHYLGNKLEGNGILYTHRGGFIDLGHLRDYADWTAYLYVLINESKKLNKQIVLNLGSEGGRKTLTIWTDKISSQAEMAELAGKIAFDLSVWHEIATWFGVSYLPFVPERYSSFSPEDLYSNLLGTKIGIEAIKSDLPYDQAVTFLLNQFLKTLGVVSSVEETYAAMEQVEGLWWTRQKALPNGGVLLVRNLSAGIELAPWLIPSDVEKFEPYILKRSRQQLSSYYDFVIEKSLKISMKKIFLDEECNTIDQHDFPLLIEYIANNQEINKQYPIKQRSKLERLNK